MSSNIIEFPGSDVYRSSDAPQQLIGTVAAKTSGVIHLGKMAHVQLKKIEKNEIALRFFRVLAEKKVLFLLRKEDDLKGADIIYVFTHDKDGEGEKIRISVSEFIEYTAENPEQVPDLEEYINEYAQRHAYMIEQEDEDASDFDDMDRWELSGAVFFRPEHTPMIDPDEDHGYEYCVIHPESELHIPAKNFGSTETYTPPLLYLMIESLYQIENISSPDEEVHIVKYGSGSTRSLTIVTTFEELSEYVDALIQMHYTLLPKKYDTHLKRRNYIREKFVTPALDPKLMGGSFIGPDKDI